MPKYLIDANLPYYFNLWNSENYIHQFDLDPKASDRSIWNYAKERNLTIVTKDSDFSNRILMAQPPPKVIHIKFGNKDMNHFFDLVNTFWNEVLEMNESHKLVNMYEERIEGIK